MHQTIVIASHFSKQRIPTLELLALFIKLDREKNKQLEKIFSNKDLDVAKQTYSLKKERGSETASYHLLLNDTN